MIGIALIHFLIRYTQYFLKPKPEANNQTIRIQFGSSLTMALELLLGADILASVIAPTSDDIGKQPSIGVLQTALNYFLERELKTSGLNKYMRPKA